MFLNKLDGIIAEPRPNFLKPFGILADTNREYQIKKATSQEKSDLLNIWRPLPDLNRCRRRERAVSWAGLDEGDVCFTYHAWSAVAVPGPKQAR